MNDEHSPGSQLPAFNQTFSISEKIPLSEYILYQITYSIVNLKFNYERVKQILDSYTYLIDQIHTHIRSIEPINFQSLHRPLFQPTSYYNSLIPKCFLNEFTVINTSADGNCFYRSVSISLFGTDMYYPLIRLLAVNQLMSNKSFFELWTLLLDNSSDNSIIKLVEIASKDREWANDCVMMATVFAVDRPIFVYKNFCVLSSRVMNLNSILDLNEAFLTYQIGTTQHVLFCSHDHQFNRLPIRIFLHADHFSSILKFNSNDDSILCVPTWPIDKRIKNGQLDLNRVDLSDVISTD
jgi:hypothetical protein